MDYGIIKTAKGKWQLCQLIRTPVKYGSLPSKKPKRIHRQILAVFRTQQEAEAALMATIEPHPTPSNPSRVPTAPTAASI